eukprot:CAMPEP_0197425904 /NCGR_PEP_ID=MMETSP1170-20131217/32895_1 /TAXON_ID=54406 /ORGANISM="Sarcinochrysis sp, Strain CCMP770" /LENGTH=58 /DNA_ID=CAMNT_0042953497 /DNA_START=58 /DNA_END=231 /DNA_ORIENTATION=+
MGRRGEESDDDDEGGPSNEAGVDVEASRDTMVVVAFRDFLCGELRRGGVDVVEVGDEC